MADPQFFIRRREFLQRTAFGAALFTTPGLFAEELMRTPRQTEGPFYPNKLPLDTDNDLIIINDNVTPAVGKISHLTGRVLSPSGEPVRNAVVEIWQADQNGIYIHTESLKRGKHDGNFQGYGRFLTSPKGEYYFRTIKPVAYTPRTPHIHVAVNVKNRRMLTTECYVKGEKQNADDFILNRIRDRKARESLILEYKPIKGSKIGELAAHFDIVIGTTPEEPEPGARQRPRRG